MVVVLALNGIGSTDHGLEHHEQVAPYFLFSEREGQSLGA